MLNWYDRGCLCRKTWLIVSGNMTRSPALRLVGFKGVELSFVSKSLAPLHRGVWASQEPPISTALLTHLGTALRALHSCRLLRLPVALTGICSRISQSSSHNCLSSTFISASTCLSSHVLD